MINAFWEFVFFSAQAQIKVIAHAAHATAATQKADRRQVRARTFYGENICLNSLLFSLHPQRRRNCKRIPASLKLETLVTVCINKTSKLQTPFKTAQCFLINEQKIFCSLQQVKRRTKTFPTQPNTSVASCRTDARWRTS